MKQNESPWFWVPTLYFAEGIPYFVVNTISVVMFKNMGMDNGSLALVTSLLSLPWVIKPFWSPFVDILKTKRWWAVSMQALMSVAFLLLAFTLPRPEPGDSVPVSAFTITLILFAFTAFASATHDISADGFYMLALDAKKQSLFVGIRNTFYRIAMVFGQGVLVVTAGILEKKLGSVPAAWSRTLIAAAVIFAAITLYHSFRLPKPLLDAPRSDRSAREIFREFGRTFATFFTKKGVWAAMAFMLLYRLPEALSMKMLYPFFQDSVEEGGLGMSTESYGLIYGTFGVIALLAGGILGGVMGARRGLKKCLWPMALSLALPCSVYLFMALAQPSSTWIVGGCIVLDQFGYGFGFTAFTLYMMYFSRGEFATAHYAICTAFMALSMMLPGLVAGYLQQLMGYAGFFGFVMLSCAATFIVVSKVEVE